MLERRGNLVDRYEYINLAVSPSMHPRFKPALGLNRGSEGIHPAEQKKAHGHHGIESHDGDDEYLHDAAQHILQNKGSPQGLSSKSCIYWNAS
jgi:hypothetical protein